MPFSFIEIEQKKSRLIFFVFISLFVFYFLTAWLLLLVSRNFLFGYFSEGRFQFSFPTTHQTLVAFVIAFFIGLLHWTFSTHNLIEKITASIDAAPSDIKDTYHQYLKNIVDEVSVAIGGRQIEAYVIPSAALNAFALADFHNNAVIGVTEGLLARLNRSQIEAVVGHEAGHIASGDCLNTTVICSLSEIYKETLSKLGGALKKTEIRGKGGLFILLIFIVLGIMNVLNRLLNTFISRQREYRADAVAVRLTRNPLALAEALKLISEKWRGAGIQGENLESIFIASPKVLALDEQGGVLADLFSTHPPINNRINILLDMAHLDEKTLEEKLKSMVRVSPVAKAEFRETPSAIQKRWFVFLNNQWQGPFLSEELRTLQGLLPTSWTREEGRDKVYQLFEEPDIAPVLGIKKEPTKDDCLCPRCYVDLNEIIYEGAPVLKCDYCLGIFVEQAKIPRIFLREDKGFSQDIIDLAETVWKTKLKYGSFSKPRAKAQWLLNCPKCHQKMFRQFFSYSYAVEIDQCQNCHGYWFDVQELEVLQYIYQNKDKFIGAGGDNL